MIRSGGIGQRGLDGRRRLGHDRDSIAQRLEGLARDDLAYLRVAFDEQDAFWCGWHETVFRTARLRACP